MNKRQLLLLSICLLPLCVFAQSDQHYTMFMYDKLLYNPGYTGSREVTSVNAQLRVQWPGLQVTNGTRTMNISVDAPVGTYMKPFRKIALGLSISSENNGIERNTDFRAYYAYRIKLEKSVLSLGLSGGISTYGAFYTGVKVFQPNDPNFAHDVYNVILPNVGSGAYWSGDKFYVGLSVPNILQNDYSEAEAKAGGVVTRRIRSYYLSGGYVFRLNDILTLKPQLLARYAKNSKYTLPPSFDINMSATAYDRIMAGVTYRTDGSLAFIVQVQASLRFSIGYSYDYMMSDLGAYAKGAHELVLGYEFNHERLKFTAPRFSREF